MVREAVSEYQQRRSERTQVTADRVLLELARIAYADPAQVFHWGPDGGGAGETLM